jgi:beta-lactamase regulating signal transducer with metallopeptidase domain
MTGSIFEAALVSALLHSLWQDALLALLAAASFRLLERHSAALRHAVGMAIFAGMLIVPLRTLWAGLDSNAEPMRVAPLAADALIPSAIAASGAIGSVLWLGWLWAFGVAAMMVRIAAGMTLFRRLDREPYAPLPPLWAARVEVLRERLGIHRTVDVRLLQHAVPPCTGRALRPVIWLPLSMLTGLGPDQIEAVIAHELAHIRRLDWIWNAVQCAVETLLFYHPAMWWLSRRIREDRENACDDLAVGVCGDPLVLAEALNSLAHLRRSKLLFAFSTNGSPLMKRVTRLLNAGTVQRPGWKLPVGVLALGCSGVVLAMNVTPAAPRASAVETPHFWEAFGDGAIDLNATVDGSRRVYRHWVDLRGQSHESYAVDGRPVAIDAGARQWIQLAMIVPPPPEPPAPPTLHPITDEPLYQSAIRQLAVDPALIAQLGTPIAIQGIGGPSYMDAARVSLTLRVSGPNGNAQLHRLGTVENGQWTFKTADVEPLAAGISAP